MVGTLPSVCLLSGYFFPIWAPSSILIFDNTERARVRIDGGGNGSGDGLKVNNIEHTYVSVDFLL